MIEENVVSQAGAVFKLSAEDIERRVRAAGFIPRRRNMRYEFLAPRAPSMPACAAAIDTMGNWAGSLSLVGA